MRLLCVLFLFSIFAGRAFGADGFAGSEDFSDFAPVPSEDTTHVEESFMYFDKNELVTVGTGMDSLTGSLGQGLSKSFPVLDLRLAHFFDFRRAIELRIGNSRFTGSMDQAVLAALGLTSMADAATANKNFFEIHVIRIGAGFKYYAANNAPENFGMDNQTFWSPNYFFAGGLNYTRFGFSMPSASLEDSMDVIVPSVGIGTDFFLRIPSGNKVKRPPTFSVEADYTLIGGWLKIVGFENTSTRSSIGDMLSLRTGVNFVF